jgi:hypothetical protein
MTYATQTRLKMRETNPLNCHRKTYGNIHTTTLSDDQFAYFSQSDDSIFGKFSVLVEIGPIMLGNKKVNVLFCLQHKWRIHKYSHPASAAILLLCVYIYIFLYLFLLHFLQTVVGKKDIKVITHIYSRLGYKQTIRYIVERYLA